MYNSLSIAIFHFGWKMQSDIWVQLMLPGFHITGGNFAQSANTINGWLRDFYGHNRHKLFNHTVLLVSVWFNFFFAHFIWAFSLMFLFSGRGYWQELINRCLGAQ
jgi:photosystem I P700 chlorophyll a apoprotein A1